MAEARKSKVVESMESNPMDKYPLPSHTKEYMEILYELIPNTLSLLKEKGAELKKEIVNYIAENTLSRPELNKAMGIIDNINKDATVAQGISNEIESTTFHSDIEKVVSYSKWTNLIISKYASLEFYRNELNLNRE